MPAGLYLGAKLETISKSHFVLIIPMPFDALQQNIGKHGDKGKCWYNMGYFALLLKKLLS